MNCQNCNAMQFEASPVHSTALCLSFPLCTALVHFTAVHVLQHCNCTNCNWTAVEEFGNCTTVAASVAAGDQFSRSAGSEASGVRCSAVQCIDCTSRVSPNNIYNNALRLLQVNKLPAVQRILCHSDSAAGYYRSTY